MRLDLVLLTVVVAGLSACTRNGGDRVYAGSPGSNYDPARNPTQALGIVTNNPASAQTSHDYGQSGEGMISGPAPLLK